EEAALSLYRSERFADPVLEFYLGLPAEDFFCVLGVERDAVYLSFAVGRVFYLFFISDRLCDRVEDLLVSDEFAPAKVRDFVLAALEGQEVRAHDILYV